MIGLLIYIKSTKFACKNRYFQKSLLANLTAFFADIDNLYGSNGTLEYLYL